MTNDSAATTDHEYVLVPRRVTPSDARWAARADELEFTALAGVRTVAERWAASLAAILGLAGTILVINGRDDISELNTGFQIAVALLLLAGLTAAVTATWHAAKAAQGTPKKLEWPTGTKLRTWEREEALAAQERLRCSRIATFVAVGAVVVAIGLTWFGTTAPRSAAATVVVLRASGGVCGRLTSDRAGRLVVTPPGGPAIALGDGELRAVVPVDGCPASAP